MNKYNFKKIEAKWQGYWEKNKTFFAKDFSKKQKKYVLVEFPYPSGAGLHMGHLRPYVAGDVYSRYLRMQGHEVLFPIGWDAFGLPAENYAIKMGVHPSVTTKKNVANAKKQMLSWGLSFDWSREVNTTDPEYYKWTQWLFLQFFENGLAYEATGIINWCPKDKTGLANEEVVDGKCERCGTSVEKKELRQWYLRITAYAEKLLEGLKNLPEWPGPVKLQQENWIGKKTGINISYDIGSAANFLLLHGKGGSPKQNFFPWLKQQLEAKAFRVQAPEMPSPKEPGDDEQAEYVLKNCKIDENTVILGHSFGGIVALRLLEKGVRAGKVILVGTPLTAKFLDGKPRPTVSMAVQKGFDFKKIKKQAKNFVALYDAGDDVVSPEDGRQYAKFLDGAFLKVKANLPHFRGKTEECIASVLAPQITCFTTRPDTNFGATFVVLGPEHPLLKNRNLLNLDIKVWKEIEKYKKRTANEAEGMRMAETRKKTGVFTGLYCINQLNNYRMSVYVADYVLGDVGTGAVVGVPGHDKRDFEFAQMFGLKIIRVVQRDAQDTGPIDSVEKVQEEEGKMVNSEFLNGLDIYAATQKIMDYMEEKGYGRRVVNYKLRDWVFSRQRYWGEPIPLVHCEICGTVPVPERDLPVRLPKVKKYEPTGTGESPLAEISKWVNVRCPKCKGKARRETNTMPQWAGSSWYWLRYADPKNKTKFADRKKLKYWQPVDVYFGGMEHTTLHLLYSRFWNLFLYDKKLVTEREPYIKRHPHGIVLASDGEKMSKSRGNVADPQIIVKKFGADTLRMYEMFLGPHELMVSWNDHGVVGVSRFLDRVWQWAHEVAGAKKVKKNSEKAEKHLHRLIKKVTEDIENFRFNTAISAFMEFHNQIRGEAVTFDFVRSFLKLLYPFASHIAEELNQKLGGKKSLQTGAWPKFDKSKITETEAEIVVQINGKVRGRVVVAFNANEAEAKEKALELQAVRQAVLDSSIKRIVFVKDRLINFVV